MSHHSDFDRRVNSAMQLSHLISWLEKQFPDDGYDYDKRESCLLAQYFRDVTKARRVRVNYDYIALDGEIFSIPEVFDDVSRGRGVPRYESVDKEGSTMRTFGDALEYAKELAVA